MAAKKKPGTFTFQKLGSAVHFALWDARRANLLVGSASSMKKALEYAGLLKADVGVTFLVKHVASGRRPHWYFQAQHGTSKLGGAGGFATEASALAAVKAVRAAAPEASLDATATNP